MDIVLVAVLQRCGTLEVLGSRNVSQITLHCGDFFPVTLSILELIEDVSRKTYPSLCRFRATNWQHQKVKKSVQCFRQRMKLEVGQKEERG